MATRYNWSSLVWIVGTNMRKELFWTFSWKWPALTLGLILLTAHKKLATWYNWPKLCLYLSVMRLGQGIELTKYGCHRMKTVGEEALCYFQQNDPLWPLGDLWCQSDLTISSLFWRSDESHYVIQEFLCHFQDIPKLAYAIRHFVITVTMYTRRCMTDKRNHTSSSCGTHGPLELRSAVPF